MPSRPERGATARRLLVAGALALAGSAGAAPPLFRDPPAVPVAAPRPAQRPAPPAQAPAQELPAASLQIELKLVADETPAAAPTGQGDRVLSTQSPAQGVDGRQTRTLPGADDTQHLATLRVRNGEAVRAEVSQWQRREQVDWVWTPQGSGLQGGARFELAHTRLQLQPAWPGGQAAVDLRWAITLPQATAPDAPPEAWQSASRLSLPLGAWTRLAALTPATSGAQAAAGTGLLRSTTALAPRTRWLMVRVSRLP